MKPAERLQTLMFHRGWSVYRLSKESGLSQSTIASILKRGSIPRIDTIEKCCRAFGITMAAFFDETLCASELTPDEKNFIQKWRDSSPEIKAAIRKIVSEANRSV